MQGEIELVPFALEEAMRLAQGLDDFLMNIGVHEHLSKMPFYQLRVALLAARNITLKERVDGQMWEPLLDGDVIALERYLRGEYKAWQRISFSGTIPDFHAVAIVLIEVNK